MEDLVASAGEPELDSFVKSHKKCPYIPKSHDKCPHPNAPISQVPCICCGLCHSTGMYLF